MFLGHPVDLLFECLPDLMFSPIKLLRNYMITPDFLTGNPYFGKISTTKPIKELESCLRVLTLLLAGAGGGLLGPYPRLTANYY